MAYVFCSNDIMFVDVAYSLVGFAWQKLILHLFPNRFNSNSLSRCANTWSCLALHKQAKLIDFLWFGGNLAYNRLTIICCARGSNARSALFLSSSKNSDSDVVLRPKVSFCHLCFVVFYCGLTYFRQYIMSMSSSVCFLLALKFLIVCSASF